VPQEPRKNCEGTPEAEVAVITPEKTGLKADILSDVFIVGARIAKKTTKDTVRIRYTFFS